MNPNLIKPFYSKWSALSIFVSLLICQPATFTFYAIYPSDIWLLLCITLQYLTKYNNVIYIRNRFIILNYGLFLGLLALLATIVQALYANISLNTNFIFHFYRFFRFVLIFKFTENIFSNSYSHYSRNFLKVYTIIGLLILILSILEFYQIGPLKSIMIRFYFSANEYLLEEYVSNVLKRLYGILGNPNATAIVLLSTLIYPLLRVVNRDCSMIKRGYYTLFFLAVLYVLFVMTGSRTAIFVLIFILFIIIISSLKKIQDSITVILLILMVTFLGLTLFHRFESKISVQDRILESFSKDEFQLSAEGIANWSGRGDLWKDRFRTFKREGNPFAIFIGMGYTKAYKDYSDNGFISTFMNNGLIGLTLKLFLFFIFTTGGCIKAVYNFRNSKINLTALSVALSTLVFALWELTADMLEHYKVGQIFYLFFSMTLILNSEKFLKDKK